MWDSCTLTYEMQFEIGDAINVVRHWRHWLILFLGTNRKNYANKAIVHLSNLAAHFPRHIAYIVMHNKSVNTSGKSNHYKPLDQMLEHYNL